MKHVTDHLGRVVIYPYPPKRIISLCPAITETLYHLQLEEEIVGRTRFCIYPKDKVKHAVNVGGTKDIKLDRIHQLKPDLIIAEKEENTKEIVEQLEKDYPVFVFEIQNIKEALRMIKDVGLITDRISEASKLINAIQTAFQTLPQTKGKRIAYMIWKKPYMVVGNNTYIQSLLHEMGFVNPFATRNGRYPSLTIDNLKNASLDYLFLATEPYPFRDKHLGEFRELLPDVQPLIIDGEIFWYGAKMVEAAPYFKNKFKDL